MSYRQIWELMKIGIEKGHLGVIMYITPRSTSCLDIQSLCPCLRCRRHRDGFVDGGNKSHECRLVLLTSFRNYQKGYEDFPGDPWLRIGLPMQRTWVQSLVQEDPARLGATKLALHSYYSPLAQSPCSTTRRVTASRSLGLRPDGGSHSPQLKEARAQQRRPSTANKQMN